MSFLRPANAAPEGGPMRRLSHLVLILVAAFALGPPAGAQEKLTAVEILGKMDARINAHDDQEMDVTLSVIDTDVSEKSYDFNIMQMGNDKRLIRFQSGELKNMSILTMNQDQVYVYLPGYKKVRRVASHNMNQSFVGSDFTNADMATASFLEVYDPVLDHEDDDYWTLKLTPKAGRSTGYAYLMTRVGKKDFLQWQTDYFDDKGTNVKRFVASKPKVFPGAKESWHSFIELSDPRTGHKTTMTVNSLKLDQGLKKKMFTTRYLQWAK
jgi:outer membrane lipoprotein-sorting protein